MGPLDGSAKENISDQFSDLATNNQFSQSQFTQKVRVVFLINSLAGGGAERVFAGLVNHIGSELAQAEINVVLLDAEVQRYELAESLNVTRLETDGGLVQGYRRLKQHFNANPPDIVISFLTRANCLSVALARHCGYCSIISVRSHLGTSIGSDRWSPVRQWFLRALYSRADHVIAVSLGVKNNLVEQLGLSPSSISVIPNSCAIDVLEQSARAESPLQDDPRLSDGYIVAVGRLVQCKRYDVLIRAYSAVNTTLPLVILGEGPLLETLQQLAQKLGVGERVIFAGFLANPHSVMARATAFVLSSEIEGFPNCLIEAMGLGLPVIATNCPHGPGEILEEIPSPVITGVHEGKHGVLVPNADVHALGQALQAVLDDAGWRRALGARARNRATVFGVTLFMSRYVHIINQQLKACTRRFANR